MVRDCDVFVFVLDSKSLTSTACQREFAYAADLGKPILPVLVADGVSVNLLPPELSRLQFIDYRKQDRTTAFSLAKALASIPPSKPLPDPLPPLPEVPVSYLGGLTQRIDRASALGFEEQSALMVDLRRSLRDPEAASDTRTLLERLRSRRDLLATIAEEIDEVLRRESGASSRPGTTVAPTPPVKNDLPQPAATPFRLAAPGTWPQWSRGALGGFAVGVVLDGMSFALSGRGYWLIGTAPGIPVFSVFGLLWAIPGAVSGTRKRVIAIAMGGALVGFGVWAAVARAAGVGEFLIVATFFGAPIGSLLGAIVGRTRESKRPST